MVAAVMDARTLLNIENWIDTAEDRANFWKLLEEAFILLVVALINNNTNIQVFARECACELLLFKD